MLEENLLPVFDGVDVQVNLICISCVVVCEHNVLNLDQFAVGNFFRVENAADDRRGGACVIDNIVGQFRRTCAIVCDEIAREKMVAVAVCRQVNDLSELHVMARSDVNGCVQVSVDVEIHRLCNAAACYAVRE